MDQIKSLEERFKYLESLGFKTPEHGLIKVESIEDTYQYFIDKRGSLDYGIDGIVFSIDDMEKMESLGVLNEKQKPKGQIALKFPTSVHYTKILDVELSFKGTQDISLVAHIEPVEIDDTTIRKASLKSYRWAIDNKVSIGSVVGVIKGGDIIPCITEVINTNINSLYVPFPILLKCPHCGGEIKTDDTQLYCENDMCNAKEAARISKFLKIIKVKGLAYKTLLKYVNVGVGLCHFLAKNWDEIERMIKVDSRISLVIWDRIRKSLEE